MPISITTTSSVTKEDYKNNRDTAIYPIFVDNMPYEAWNSNATIATSRTEFFQLKATGASSYNWTVVSGELPSGLNLTLDGKLQGTATKEGLYTFTVQAQFGSETDQETLSVTAWPYRAKWYAEAKFGVWNTVQPGTYPRKFLPADIPDFESRILANWNPTTIANTLKSLLGANYLVTNAYAGDSVAVWPKTTVTTRPMHTVRDYIDEQGNACHAAGLKHMVYFAPDSISNAPRWQNTDPAGVIEWDGTSTYTTNPALVGVKIAGKDGMNSDTPVIYLSPSESAWGTRNTSLIRELAQKNSIDGFWIDVGAGDRRLYPTGAIDPDFFRWNNIWPIIRYYDPWKIVGVNPGYNDTRESQGNLWQYPHIDYNIYEGMGGTLLETTLVTPEAPVVKKKMATDNLNILDTTFVFSTSTSGLSNPPKSARMIIDSIKRAWKVGATYSLQWPTLVDGTVFIPEYMDTLTEIGNFVKANQGFSEEPRIEIIGNVATISTVNNSRIYYTLDGSTPTKDSLIYAIPITLTSDTKIRAISVQFGIPESRIAEAIYKSAPIATFPGTIKLYNDTITGNNLIKENNSYYRGMNFNIINGPITIYSIGRVFTGATGSRNIIIKKFPSEEGVLFDTFVSGGNVENGFEFSNVAPITLQPGFYYIGIQENSVENWASNLMTTKPNTKNITVLGPKILSPNGNVIPITQDNLGQFINFKYKLEKTSKNLAQGKTTVFVNHNTGAILPQNAGNLYASNIVDGDNETIGQPSGDYEFITRIDLSRIRKISKVVFKVNLTRGQPVDLRLSTGLTLQTMKTVKTLVNNDIKTLIFEFDPIYAQYIHLQVVKPTGPDQRGSSFAVSEIEIY